MTIDNTQTNLRIYNGHSEAVTLHCPVCGPEDRKVAGYSNDLQIVSCCGCGLMYVGESPPIDETEDFFREEHVPDEELAETAYVYKRQHSLKREAQLIRGLLPDGGRLLDVGTASGLFLAQFADDRDWCVEGVEPSRVSAMYARRNFNLKVHEGYLRDLQFSRDHFDVVCSLDAFLCHREPVEDMEEFYRILAPGGYLAIEIPGHHYRLMNSLLTRFRRRGRNTLRLNAGVNFYYYTRETLTKLAANAGFEFVESHPEAMPRTPNSLVRVLRNSYDASASLLYRMTGGRVHIAAKEFCIFQKPATITLSSSIRSNTAKRKVA
ncbi:MAG: class I SAM-dependent methyltransferase [Planctomycetaceae bacterium]|nr:class I SAM-dependent methyltransferase [Planctomycetaceae bacterium]